MLGPGSLARRFAARQSSGWARSHLFGAASLALMALALSLPFATRASEGVPSPAEEDRLVDTDQDGLADILEAWLGTDAACPDTDMDGIPDGREVAQRSNPLVPTPVWSAISGVKLDYIPEAGSIRFAITVFSSVQFQGDVGIDILLGLDTRLQIETRLFNRLGTTFRASDGSVASYVSDRFPLTKLPKRFSLGVILHEGPEITLDDALLGVRQRHFFRTEETLRDDGTVVGSTVFITPIVLTETEPGFSPNEDCKQIFGRINGPIKIVLSETCEAEMDRYCPDNCGRDVGLRVICIRDLFRR